MLLRLEDLIRSYPAVHRWDSMSLEPTKHQESRIERSPNPAAEVWNQEISRGCSRRHSIGYQSKIGVIQEWKRLICVDIKRSKQWPQSYKINQNPLNFGPIPTWSLTSLQFLHRGAPRVAPALPSAQVAQNLHTAALQLSNHHAKLDTCACTNLRTRLSWIM